MNINIQFLHTETNAKVASLVFNKLEQLNKKFDWIIGAEVFLKEENNKEGRKRVCETRLIIPGPEVYSFATDKSFEAAISEAIDDIESQLISRKGKWEPQHFSNN